MNLAVVAGCGDAKANLFDLARGEFHGTAFCIARDLFITAAHVYEAAASYGEVALSRLTPGRQQTQTVREFEVFPDIDIALLRCPNLWAEILPFNFDPLYYLTDVVALGFAFGLELSGEEGESHVHQLRAFKGHVMTRRALSMVPSMPPGYEVSFVPPPGLSGSPLLLPQGNQFVVTGVVLKHHTAELEERKMDLGLALDAVELLAIDSTIVGGSLAERVFGRPKPTPRTRRP